MWNTGCNVVNNHTEKELRIVDGEDPHHILDIPPKGHESFKGVILPWAANDSEVTSKSFHVSYWSNSKQRWMGWVHVFQNYSTDHPAWVEWSSVSPHGDAMQAGFRSSYVDINVTVNSDGEPDIEFVQV